MGDKVLQHLFKTSGQSLPLSVYVKRASGEPFTVPKELETVYVFDPCRSPLETASRAHRIEKGKARSVAELVDQCVVTTLSERYRTHFKCKHVLSQGFFFQKRKDIQGRPAGSTVECRCPNEAVQFLKRRSWETVLLALGEDLFKDLLLNKVLLVKEGNAHIQLAGPILAGEIRRAGTDLLKEEDDSAQAKLLRNGRPDKIDRQRIFYSQHFTRSCNLPRNHPLNISSMTGPRLWRMIFRGANRNRGMNHQRQQRLWATQLLKQHRKCPYGWLLQKHCPCVFPVEHPAKLAEIRVTHEAVSTFLKQVFIRILPRSTFPEKSHKGKRRFLELVTTFVSLQRRSSLLVSQVCTETGLEESVASFLFHEILVPLLRSMFYCTEGSGSGQEVYYFRKPVWHAICNHELEVMCAKSTSGKQLPMLQPCLTTGANLKRSEAFDDVSKLRFVPKISGTGARAVMNCKAVNFKLTFAHQAIKSAFRTQTPPHPCHPQILGLNEFYGKYKAFVLSCKAEMGEIGSLGFQILSMDIEKCFDNIPHDKMKHAVEICLGGDDFRIRGHNAVFINGPIKRLRSITTRVVESKASHEGHIKCNTTGNVSSLKPTGMVEKGSFTTVNSIFTRARESKRPCVLLDKAECFSISSNEVMRKVNQYICSHFTSFGGERYFKQTRGIPQGSVLSSLLCTIHYQHFETDKIVPILFDSASLPLKYIPGQTPLKKKTPSRTFCSRLLDDYLVISTNSKAIAKFQSKMEKGYPEYGIHVKAEKTRLSSPQSPFVTWCGFKFDSRDLSVTFDLERIEKLPSFQTPANMLDSSAQQLRQAFQIIALRCDPILFDRNINPVHVAKSNLRILLSLGLSKLSNLNRARYSRQIARFTFNILFSRCDGETDITLRIVMLIQGQLIESTVQGKTSRLRPAKDSRKRNLSKEDLLASKPLTKTLHFAPSENQIEKRNMPNTDPAAENDLSKFFSEKRQRLQ